MSMRYEIELPLPPKALSSNRNAHNRHWYCKAKAAKEYRQSCGMAYLAARNAGRLPCFDKPVIVHLHYYLRRIPHDDINYYPKDEDNARGAFKAGQDALVDAGIIPADSRKFVHAGETRLFGTKKEHQGRTCLIVIIETLEDTNHE